MKKLLQSKKRGFAIALAMLVVVILLAMGTGLLKLGLSSRIFSIRTASDITAQCAADAGLAKALFEMNGKLKAELWDESTMPLGTNISLPNCDAVYSYTVTGNLGSGYTIQSTGNSDQAQRTVSCTLQLKGPFEAAIFTEQHLYMKSGATVDWYNYDADDRDMQIGTNSTVPSSVVLKNTSIINGNIVVGMGGNPDDVIIDNGATINGETFTLTQIYELSPVTVPGSLESSPSLGIIRGNTTINNSAQYSSIRLPANKKITIEGDVTLYIAGDVILGNSAELQIAENASLTLYLGGDFEGKNSSMVNNLNMDPHKLKIYGLDSCTSIGFKNSSDLYGAIYAPNADVVMFNSADMYGAVTAKSFEQKNSGTFYYDTSLREVSTSDEAVSFTITNWHE